MNCITEGGFFFLNEIGDTFYAKEIETVKKTSNPKITVKKKRSFQFFQKNQKK